MIALDTNVLVRYIVQDHKSQAAKATAAIERLSAENPAFISCIVLCEINWVLTTAYKIPKVSCLETMTKILAIAVFDIERLEACLVALKRYETGKADFSDYLIQQIAHQEGYDTVLTFDKKALKYANFQSP